MALDLIPTLIDKQDNFEIIRDQIGAILAVEVQSQMAKAVTAGKETQLWDFKSFNEGSNPIEDYLNQKVVTTPIVNVWYDRSVVDLGTSNPTEQQKFDGIFNIDCYGYGVAKGDGGTGQIPGDLDAKFELERILRLVRNILMSSINIYLQLQGNVWTRMTNSIISFQPEAEPSTVQQIAAARIEMGVQFSEFSPQGAESVIEFLAVDVLREETGLLVAEAHFDFVAP